MSRAIGVCALLLGVCATAWSEELKTSRVALFSSGVGYFESAATVEGTTSLETKFRVDQINDVLKSLVLRDLDGGTISAVQYPSRDPVDKALKSFAVDVTGRPTLGDLLNQLRGVLVEIKAPNLVRGSIIGVEKEAIVTPEKAGKVEREVLALLTDDGLRTFTLRELTGVKILDAKLEGELRKALETLAASHDSEKKTVTLNFAGEGKRRVMVGYMLETPIWKTTYRLVLADDKKPYLQGWAIVENTTDQDWENVRMSLVSGRPISFAMDLYQPLYVPRPMERLALYGSVRAPEYEGEVAAKPEGKGESLAGADYLDGGGKGRKRAAKRSMDTRTPAAAGESDATGQTQVNNLVRNAWVSTAGNAATMNLADSGVASDASAEAAGELFEYAVQTPVSLKRQDSAMLPIVTTEIEGNKLSIFNPATHPKHPLNGLKIKNTSGLFLMQGPVTVFEAGVYAGDAKLPDLQKDELRLIAYALDLSTDVEMKKQDHPEEWTNFWIVKGTLGQRKKLVDEREYTLKNKGDKARTVLIEQPIEADWKLVEPKEPAEQTASMLRFKVEVPPGPAQSLKVRLEKVVDEWLLVSSLKNESVAWYVQQKTISEAVKQALGKVVELQIALEDTRRQIKQAKDEIEAISTEQTRIRENMKTLSETSEVRRRYEKKLDEQETRVEKLREQLAELSKQEESRRKALEDYIVSLTVE